MTIFWLGGSPCSGKSSIANALAKTYGLQHYCCDDRFDDHLQNADLAMQPTLARLRTLSPDAIWLAPVPDQIKRVQAIYREEFASLYADLQTIGGSIIAEGAALMPEWVAPLISENRHAVWLLPTPDFQREQYRQREWIHDVINATSNPEQAWHNWMARDSGFADRVEAQARGRGLSCLRVDGTNSLAHNTQLVAAHFGLTT